MEGVQIMSRRTLRPARSSPSRETPSEADTVHLTPWDLRLITVDYIQKGILLPRPHTPPGGEHLVNHLASSFSSALARFYPLAGRLAVAESSDKTITVSLRCSNEGAEFIHAVAPGVTVADIVAPLYIPKVVWSFFPLNGLLGTDVVADSGPIVALQVTELADGVFVAMSLNHGVADGTTFWHLFNTWSEISRSGDTDHRKISIPPPVLERWFLDTYPVPITVPFGKLEHIVKRWERRPVQECFFPFSAESVKKLKERANAEMEGTATAAISSLQSLLSHLWRSITRARGLAPAQATSYGVLIGCRGRVKGIPQGYLGNAVEIGTATSTAGEILEKGLGWTAWLLNRTVASFDEAALRDSLACWHRAPQFANIPEISNSTVVYTGSSPRFDVYGNDFGWGKPVAVRSGPGNKADGKATVYEGPDGGGSMALEVCLHPEALARLVADEEFMDAVSTA